MNVLIIGTGVIGSVYGAELAAAGHQVAVLEHHNRIGQGEQSELITSDTAGGRTLRQPVTLVTDAAARPRDLILVAVRADQLPMVFPTLRRLAGHPTILFFGNNPEGRAAIPADLAGSVTLGFPGVGGFVRDGIVQYQRIPQQATTLQAGGGPAVDNFGHSLRERGFPVTRTEQMDGWLAYHAVFVASVAAALYRCGTSPTRLAADRRTLRLMCRAVEEGFAALAGRGVKGVPRNLRLLHRPILRRLAVRYWARTFRSPMGEACLAAHARHAEPEMRSLMTSVATLCGIPGPSVSNLGQLFGHELCQAENAVLMTAVTSSGTVSAAPPTVVVRSIRPDDASALQAFHRRLSDDTIRNRFFGLHPELSEQEARRFTSLNAGAETALVATLDNQIVGVGRSARLGHGDVAEVAFVVEDGYQHHGIGTTLLDLLARLGWADGLRRFVADTFATNGSMLDVFMHTPAAVTVLTTRRDGPVVHLMMRITPPPSLQIGG